jgi:5'-nucleotidase
VKQGLSLAATLIVATATVLSSSANRQDPASGDTVAVQLLAINDFHGNLEPPTGANGRIGGVDAGGVEYLATHLAELKARNPNTVIVSAGDNVGASPFISALFHDQPTIEALNAAGLEISSVGNHEFDEGWVELYRMQRGGCHPVDGCVNNMPFKGATFRYLSANVILDPHKAKQPAPAGLGWQGSPDRSAPLLPPYTIKEIGGVKIGFIGMVLKDTKELVLAEGVEGLTFKSEADTANKLVPELKKQNVRAIVVLIHEGGIPGGDDYNGCPNVTGPIVRIADRMSDDIDVIVSGHTHNAYNCTIGKKLVTSAASFGRLITSIDLRIDKRTDEVVSKTARNVIVTRDVPKDPAETAIIDRYRPFYSATANKVVGSIAADISRAANAAGESPLGDVIADAMFESAAKIPGGAAVAFMNPGGIRTDFAYDLPAGSGPKPVTFGEASTIMPFQNRLVVRTMKGSDIKKVLEQQFDNPGPGQDKMLQVSRGFTYSYDRSKPRGQRVDQASIMIGGQKMVPSQKYRVATNEFIVTGGDGFTVLTQGTAQAEGEIDLDLLTAYLGQHSPLQPAPVNRVLRIK